MPPLGPPVGLFVESKTHLGGGYFKNCKNFCKKIKNCFCKSNICCIFAIVKGVFRTCPKR